MVKQADRSQAALNLELDAAHCCWIGEDHLLVFLKTGQAAVAHLHVEGGRVQSLRVIPRVLCERRCCCAVAGVLVTPPGGQGTCRGRPHRSHEVLPTCVASLHRELPVDFLCS